MAAAALSATVPAMPPEAGASLRLAAALGAQALAVWAATVAVVLLVAALAWRSRQRRRAVADARGPATPTQIALRAGAGFIVIVGAAALFAALAEGRQAGAAIGRIDDAFALALRSTTPPEALQVAAVLTHAGDPALLTLLGVVVGAALLGARHLALAVGWVAAVLGNAVLNTTLKGIFARVRPVHDGVLAQAEGYSFPSGHTSGAVAAYGMLAYLALRLLPPAGQLAALVAVSVLAVSTAFSRVFLGVHYVSDVVAGALSGGAWLAACIAAVEVHRRRRSPAGG